MYQRSHSQERQQLKEIEPAEFCRLLANLQAMDRRIAEALMLAVRLYHSAVEMMYSEPEFAYLFLVASLEAIASTVHSEARPSDEISVDHYLDSTYHGWRACCDISTPEKKKQTVEMLLTTAYFTQLKLRKFVEDNLPDAFWNEKEDDAKPDCFSRVVGTGPDGLGVESIHWSDKTIQEWERTEKGNLKRTLDDIYKARSKFIHEGKKFPPSVVLGHFQRIPIEASRELMERSMNQDLFLEVPPLLTFERLVSYSIVEFLRKQEWNPELATQQKAPADR